MSKKYNKRVTLERINSRLYNKYAFENHTIRGKVKIEFAVYISMSIMRLCQNMKFSKMYLNKICK